MKEEKLVGMRVVSFEMLEELYANHPDLWYESEFCWEGNPDGRVFQTSGLGDRHPRGEISLSNAKAVWGRTSDVMEDTFVPYPELHNLRVAASPEELTVEDFEVKAKKIMSIDAEDEYHAVRLSQEMYRLKEQYFDVIQGRGTGGVRYCPLCKYHDYGVVGGPGTCEKCILNPGHVGCHPAYEEFAKNRTREKFDELKAAIDALPSEPPEDKTWSPYGTVQLEELYELKARVAQLEEENRGLRKEFSRVQDAIDGGDPA